MERRNRHNRAPEHGMFWMAAGMVIRVTELAEGKTAPKLPVRRCAEAVEGLHIRANSSTRINGGPRDRPFPTLTNEAFQEQLRRKKMEMGVVADSSFQTQTYDAVWAMAATMKKSELKWIAEGQPYRLKNFSYDNATGKPMTDTMFSIMGNLDFVGVSGPISFAGPDRRGVSAFYQNQGRKL
ncbi:PREDICTED: uncharacterized protein LOC106815467 [Priapulus caudatus]|uniref:Uncharacterized protein LOC106815467 n=1 Tax=Priapulus caudatus TaxID=37621 RepID=A0ABM1ET99_PRICU|nr:PREDICTED: uncharacterized protein LOC106815467 [Priapulus caudatus]